MKTPGDFSLIKRLSIASIFTLVLMLICAATDSRVLAQASPTQAPSTPVGPATSGQVPTAQVQAIPAARAARNVAIITIHGAIDQWTARSVIRRIKLAERDGADALVLDINTPGGEMTAMMVISTAIKQSSIKNTVAWINPQAYSAGAVIALACRERITAPAGQMGDALPIEISLLEGYKPIPDAEREKFIGPILADVVDSSRRSGVDENLVQGFVRRGVELWLVEHTKTGQRLFVTEAQYELAVGSKPVRINPTTKSVTGPIDPRASTPSKKRPSAPSSAGADGPQPTDIAPAAPAQSPKLTSEINTELAARGTPASPRPDLTSSEHGGQYRLVEYVADGRGVITLHESELLRYGLVSEVVADSSDLQAFFGATNVATLEETWSENVARLLSNIFVRMVLVVIFIAALLIEMTHPGLIAPGAIAALCLVGLVLPPIMVNMAAWWMVVAILVGVVCIALELFVTPGMIVFGMAGVILLFGGLTGVVVGGPQGLFPTTAGARSDLTIGLLITLLSSIVALGVVWAITRNLKSIPIFNKLVLNSASLEDADGNAVQLREDDQLPPLQAGAIGTTITPLRPGGKAQFGERVVDVSSDAGYVDAGQQVRVVSDSSAGRGFEVRVERV